MKRIIAGLIALTAVICTLTSCEKSAVNEVEDNTMAETTVSEETTAEAETTQNVTEADISDTSYEDVIYEFIDAYNALDYQKTFEMQMPDDIMKVIDFAVKYDETEKRDADEIIMENQRGIYGNTNDEHITVRIKNIIGMEQMKDKDLLDLKYTFGMYEWMIKLSNEKGNDPDFELDNFTKEIENVDINDLLELSNISDGHRVDMELENEKTGNTYDGYIYVMNYKGKWKVNANYLFGSDWVTAQKMLKNAPRSIYNAQNSALVEMDEESDDINWRTCFIISSDESKDYNVPEYFDGDNFMKKTRQYFEAIDNTEWFSVICNGVAYVTAFVKDDPENIGKYPDFMGNEEVISAIGDKLSDDMSFDERYDICVEEINKNK